MASSSPTQNFVADTWVKATWEEFIVIADNPDYEKAKFYYDRGYMRIEMPPIGSSRSQDNHIAVIIVNLYASVRQIRIKGLVNCSFRRAGIREFQPDLAFYIGTEFRFPPRSNSPINVEEFPPPTLVIELGATSFNDDIGRKRLIYERAGVREYWVVDVNVGDIIAFEISQGSSGEIQESRVLPGLEIALVKEALQRSQTQDDGEITRWLLQSFSQG
ncbi:Uma2 family endonuclease [Chroococcidiopsis sp.]|uniref:Uma2 family endonuclease n=1 Tax=Chroococcidiopsis sp. TaxID=3088168 RepID=UPI003F2A4C68